MKQNKDYTLTALLIPFLMAVLFNLPACYSSKEVKQDNIETVYTCPDCGETGCIYEAIDDCIEGETDQDIENAIQAICKERGITDPKTIDLLRANYYL